MTETTETSRPLGKLKCRSPFIRLKGRKPRGRRSRLRPGGLPPPPEGLSPLREVTFDATICRLLQVGGCFVCTFLGTEKEKKRRPLCRRASASRNYFSTLASFGFPSTVVWCFRGRCPLTLYKNQGFKSPYLQSTVFLLRAANRCARRAAPSPTPPLPVDQPPVGKWQLTPVWALLLLLGIHWNLGFINPRSILIGLTYSHIPFKSTLPTSRVHPNPPRPDAQLLGPRASLAPTALRVATKSAELK